LIKKIHLSILLKTNPTKITKKVIPIKCKYVKSDDLFKKTKMRNNIVVNKKYENIKPTLTPAFSIVFSSQISYQKWK